MLPWIFIQETQEQVNVTMSFHTLMITSNPTCKRQSTLLRVYLKSRLYLDTTLLTYVLMNACLLKATALYFINCLFNPLLLIWWGSSWLNILLSHFCEGRWQCHRKAVATKYQTDLNSFENIQPSQRGKKKNKKQKQKTNLWIQL